MDNSISTIVHAVNKVQQLVADANKQGNYIAITRTGSYLQALSLAPALNIVIDLSDDDALFKIKELQKELIAFSPKKRAFKVLFIARTRKSFNYQCEVEALDEAQAKVAARSELMSERLDPSDYKTPVITVLNSQSVGSAA
jgi:hypothetical protein